MRRNHKAEITRCSESRGKNRNMGDDRIKGIKQKRIAQRVKWEKQKASLKNESMGSSRNKPT